MCTCARAAPDTGYGQVHNLKLSSICSQAEITVHVGFGVHAMHMIRPDCSSNKPGQMTSILLVLSEVNAAYVHGDHCIPGY